MTPIRNLWSNFHEISY